MRKVKHARYRTNMFGFPVVINDAPLRKTSAGWILDIPPLQLQWALMRALAHKPVPLTGNEIRFIRQSLDMTLTRFGDRFDVSHAAVIAWEKSEEDSTQMKWATEKDIRLFLLENVPGGREEISRTYKELEKKPRPMARPRPLQIFQKDLAFALP